jgi:hypothetical protein
MQFRRLLHPGNRRVRLLVGLLLAGFLCIQCTRTEAFRPSQHVTVVSGQAAGAMPAEELNALLELARTDHVALLERCLRSYQSSYRDYLCTFIKQERINHRVCQEQVIEVKFMESPYSVAMSWTPRTAQRNDRLLFVEGKYDGQMLVRPTGLLASLVGTVKRGVDSPEARQSSLHPVNQFGFRRSLEGLLAVYRKAQQAGDLHQEFAGIAQVNGRRAMSLVRYLPAKQDYPAYKTVTYIDLEYLVPVLIEFYDWNQQPSSSYAFKDVRFNVGLTNQDFLPQANDMKPPA